MNSFLFYRWNDVISANPKTMIKFKLHLGKITGRSWDVFSESIDSTRKYRDISVHSTSVNVGHSVIKHFGEDLRHLKFCDLEVTEIGAFTESFVQLQKLEKLKFVTSVVKKECLEFQKVNGANLPKLKTVVLEQNDWTVKFAIAFYVGFPKFILFQFLRLVKHSQLEILKINSTGFYLGSTRLVDFLSNQKNLKMLALSNMDFTFSGISLQQIQQLNFPLKKLALNNLTTLFGSDVNLTEFMKKVGNTLEELEVAGRYRQSNALYDQELFKHLHKLQVLDIDIEFAPNKRSSDFFKSFGSNTSIKTLIIRSYHKNYDQKMLSGFVTNLPSLETLIIDGDDVIKKYLRLISNNLHQLKQLNIKAASGSVFKNVTIPSLTTIHLTVAWLADEDDWKMICRAFPNIEKLSLGTLRDIDFESISVITRAWKKSLRVVFMGKKFNAVVHKVELFFQNCKSMEKLYLGGNLPGIGSKALKDVFPKASPTKNTFVRCADDFNLWMTE